MCFSIFSEDWVWVDLHGIYLCSVCGCIWGRSSSMICCDSPTHFPVGGERWCPMGDSSPHQGLLVCPFPSYSPMAGVPNMPEAGEPPHWGCNPHGCKRRNTETRFMLQNSQGMTDLPDWIMLRPLLGGCESMYVTVSQFCRAAVKWHAHTSTF